MEARRILGLLLEAGDALAAARDVRLHGREVLRVPLDQEVDRAAVHPSGTLCGLVEGHREARRIRDHLSVRPCLAQLVFLHIRNDLRRCGGGRPRAA